MRYISVVLFGLLASPLLSAQAHAERRVALVVGNAKYANTPALRNPVNDAQDIAGQLKKLGFDVILAIDVDQSAFARQIDDFGRRLESADVGLFYYAGHGLQVNEKNYLVSTNAKLESEFLVPSETIELNAVIRLMESRTAVNLVFLDACRNNPLADQLRRNLVAERRAVALGRGLAKVDPTGRDTLIAFSAAPGQEASDGEGRNSPFTQSLVRHLPESGVEVSLMLKLVSADVREATHNGQRPQQLSDMAQAFYFAKAEAVPEKPAAPVAIVAPPIPPADRSLELAFWQSSLAANDCVAVRSYLTRFPDGTFTDLARLSERRLCTAKTPPSANTDSRAPVVAALPPANAPPGPGPSPADLARNLQAELMRVGCGPSLKASGEWDAASRAALAQFNRYGNAKFTGPTPEAIAALHERNDRVCPLVCGRGMKAEGETCVAIPVQPDVPPQQADRPPNDAPSKKADRPRYDTPPKQADRPRPARPARAPDESPPRQRATSGGRDAGFAPEGGQQRGTRANNAISETPFTQGGQKCHTLDVMGLAPRIVCP